MCLFMCFCFCVVWPWKRTKINGASAAHAIHFSITVEEIEYGAFMLSPHSRLAFKSGNAEKFSLNFGFLSKPSWHLGVSVVARHFSTCALVSVQLPHCGFDMGTAVAAAGAGSVFCCCVSVFDTVGATVAPR